MDRNVAEAIVTAGQDLGLEISLRPDYSGRGMYGETTTAAIYENESDLRQAIAQAAIDVRNQPAADDDLTADDFIQAIGSLRSDNLGRSLLVY